MYEYFTEITSTITPQTATMEERTFPESVAMGTVPGGAIREMTAKENAAHRLTIDSMPRQTGTRYFGIRSITTWSIS